jgi:hypothetical protein
MTAVAAPTTTAPAGTRRWPLPARWLLTAFAFPPSGLLAMAVAGSVDAPPAALAAGAIVGAGVGAGQWLALREDGEAPSLRRTWPAVTSAATAVGLAIGAGAVGYETGTADLVTMGLITGTAIGAAQATVLHRAGRTTTGGAVVWAAVVPVLWALGWFVTVSAGVDVERQWAQFGITGALTVSALGGLVLSRILGRTR